MSKLLCAAALLPFAYPALALENVNDLRIEVGSYATSNTHDRRDTTAGSDSAYLTTGTTETTGDDSYDRTSFGITFIWGRLYRDGGLLLSGGFSVNDSYNDVTDAGAAQTFSLESTIYEGKIGVGYGLPISNWSFFEVMADVGLGYMQADGIDRSQAFGWEEVHSASGGEASLGAHVGWTACIHRHLTLGLLVYAARHAATMSNSFATGAYYDEHFQQTLYDFRFAVGYRF
jgi:hypothetical protein